MYAHKFHLLLILRERTFCWHLDISPLLHIWHIKLSKIIYEECMHDEDKWSKTEAFHCDTEMGKMCKLSKSAFSSFLAIQCIALCRNIVICYKTAKLWFEICHRLFCTVLLANRGQQSMLYCDICLLTVYCRIKVLLSNYS